MESYKGMRSKCTAVFPLRFHFDCTKVCLVEHRLWIVMKRVVDG
jgi:hypothetical protein